MNTILQFIFETGDTDCPYYQIFVIVMSNGAVDYVAIEDSIERLDCNDLEFNDIVEDVMKESGLSWSFVSDTIPESRAIHTFWI